jgi:molybdopterin synthase catalytic subunit
VVDDMLELHEGPLDAKDIFCRWYDQNRVKNYGAHISFVGVIRDEDSISGLSFDVYEPILSKWLGKWQSIAKERSAKIFMAHSIGDVPLHQSSFVCTIFSPKRRVALELVDEFVEDFKANAPIWKYDLYDNKRVYAEDRSQIVDGGGLLA